MALQPIISNNRGVADTPYSSRLKSTANSGGNTISLYSISQFATNKILLIGEYGQEGSEIIRTHASTDPSENTVTLASNLTKTHVKDSPVRIISFDKIEFSHSETETGGKTTLGSLVDIDPEAQEMQYEDSVNIGGFYFTRYKNSLTGIFSDYSDPIPYAGMPANTVGYAIDTAMTETGAKFSGRITYSLLLGWSKQMLALIRGKMRAFSKYQEFGYNLGQATIGTQKYAMPETIYDKNSNRSILNVRVGSNRPLIPIDRSEYIQATLGAVYTEVSTEATAGATSLVLDDTKDLPDEGSVLVFVGGTKHVVEFTENDRDTNTLTTEELPTTVTVNSKVWYGLDEDDPQYFSVWDGYLYIYPLPMTSRENIYMDFYTDIETIDSQMDVLQGTHYNMLIPYLKWKIRSLRERNGLDDLKDPDYLQFRELLNDYMRVAGGAENQGFHPRKYAPFSSKLDSQR